VSVRIPPGEGEYGESVVDHVKIFPLRPEIRFEHRIHEQLLRSLREAGVEVIAPGLHVVHQNYDRSPEGQARKRRRDFRLLELEIRERPEHPFVLFNLGMTHLQACGEYEVAEQYFRRSLQRMAPEDSIFGKAAWYLARCRVGLDDLPGAVAVNEAGREALPDDPELLLQAGQLYQGVGSWDAARACLERLVQGDFRPAFTSAPLHLRTCQGPLELALLHRAMGDLSHSAAILRGVAEAHPAYLPARLELAESLLRLGDRPAAAELDRIPAGNGLDPELRRLRALLGETAQGRPA
jgi:tetratricopeptide (TPR) repeat protein